MDMYEAFSHMASSLKGQVGANIDVGQVMNSELNEVVDFNMWLETVEIQKVFNNSVAPGWQLDRGQDKYNYWMAILDETVEVLGSKHWKWWKDKNKMNQVDWDNVKVELVDIFHFVLSIAIQHESQHIIFSQIVNLEMNRLNPDSQKTTTPRIQDKDFFKNFWDEFLMAVQYKNLPLVAVRMVEYWYRAGGTAEDLFMHYRIKSALNEVRQEFGYGTSTYAKNWLDVQTGEMVEDNVIAGKLAQGIELNEDTVKNIKESLTKYYLKHVSV